MAGTFDISAAADPQATPLAFRWARLTLSGAAAVALLTCSLGFAGTAKAGLLTTTLCPNQATVAAGTSSNVSGPLDGTSCGASDTAVQISISDSTDEAALTFNSSTPGYPGLALGNVLGISADVAFITSGTDQPYFILRFVDSSDSLGQGNAADNIIFLEFQSSTLAGNTLAFDPNSTLLNLFDNTTGVYLQGGQHDTNTLDGWLAAFPDLKEESLQGFSVASGLTGGDTGPETLTVNSVTLNSVPEPASATLLGVALAGLGLMRRRRAG